MGLFRHFTPNLRGCQDRGTEFDRKKRSVTHPGSIAEQTGKSVPQRNARDGFFRQSIKNRCELCTVRSDVEQGTGIEPAFTAWEAVVLPIYEPCIVKFIIADPA